MTPGRLVPLLEAIRAGGLTTVEITMNSPAATAQIHDAVRFAQGTLNVGAGTVTTVALMDQALEAGASFIVTPVVQADVIARCVQRRVPVFPGACSPTEIVEAWERGASLVKIFPTEALGPAYVRRLKAMLPDLKLLPTGGINLGTLAAFREAGADGFGIGSPLFDRARLQEEDWGAVTARCRSFVDQLR
jgi:2-dehydro-3-deoxyphosphogluconate aldolase/(4S)-4-hydroxy-2-oxoglutarate aldolase